MPAIVKRGISLRKDQDEKLARLAESLHKKYSALLQEAVDRYLEAVEATMLEMEYARYYGRKQTTEKDSALATTMWDLSKKTWPK